MDLFKVTLNKGIPVSGDGDVATINALMADGGLQTIGNMTDAASAFTDATPVSGVALWKQISKVLQSMIVRLPSALGVGGGMRIDGSGIPIAVTMTAVPPHDVTNSGLFPVQSKSGLSGSASFICGATPVAAGDVIGVGGGKAALTFAGVAAWIGELDIVSATLEIDRAAIGGETTYRLHLYNTTPPSALNDSDPWFLPVGDRPYYLGFLDFDIRVDTGTMQWCEKNNLMKQITTLGTTVYGYLVSNGAYTATASPLKVTLKCKSA